MSACLETAPSIAPSLPTTDARAARLAKFRREQLIVDYLNRGVSVAEIAARLGLSEKRMRAVIKEISAHRCPHPPEEFLAIQVSRLNEALLVAASAMSGANLKAVDRVVKIVSELDRYHGFAAFVGRRRPEPRLDAPAEGATTYGAALVCQARFAPGDDEEIEFERNTQFPLAPHQRGEGWGEGLGRLATVGARPQIPPQAFERVDLRPGLRRARKPQTSPRSQACFEMRRIASRLDMRAERSSPPPPPQTTTARKIPRKALKRLNPRPGLRRARRRRTPSPLRTIARKFPHKTLKRLVLRPGLRRAPKLRLPTLS